MDAQLEQQVRERAFQLWETGALKGASDFEYWIAAESELRARLSAAPVAVAAPAKPAKARAAKTGEKAPIKKAAAKAKK